LKNYYQVKYIFIKNKIKSLDSLIIFFVETLLIPLNLIVF
jgi:hypothetical protein